MMILSVMTAMTCSFQFHITAFHLLESSFGIWFSILISCSLQDVLDFRNGYNRSDADENQIEGKLDKGQKVVVIEDLISTGGSSLKAVEALRASGAEVLGMGAIFTYGFAKSVSAFEEVKCKFFTLSDYPTLLDIALKHDYIKKEDHETLLRWYQNPEAWSATA